MKIDERTKQNEIIKKRREDEIALLKEKEKNTPLISIEDKKKAARKVKIAKMEINLAKRIEKHDKYYEKCSKFMLQILEIADVLLSNK